MKIFYVFVFALLPYFVSSQEIEKNNPAITKAINILYDALDKKDFETLKPFLHADFTTANHKGFIALQIMQAAVMQYPLVKEIQITNVSYESENIGVEVKFIMENKTRDYEILLSKDFLFIEINIFKTIVKKQEDFSSNEKKLPDYLKNSFELSGGIIILNNITINGEQGAFIFDTGAPQLILNIQHFEPEYNKNQVAELSQGVSGSVSGTNVVKVSEFKWAEYSLKNFDALAIDIQHLEKKLNKKILGLIGYNLIKDYQTIIDYQSQTLELVKLDGEGETIKGLLLKTKMIIPFKLHKHLPVIEAKIQNKTLKLAIDTGAEFNLLDTPINNELTKSAYNSVVQDTLSGANKEQSIVKSVNIKKTHISGKTFKNMKTVFSDISHLKKAYKLDVDGIIGFQFLSKNKIALNFRKKELMLLQN